MKLESQFDSSRKLKVNKNDQTYKIKINFVLSLNVFLNEYHSK